MLRESALDWPSAFELRPELVLKSVGSVEVLFDDNGLPRFTHTPTSRYKTIGGPWFAGNLCFPDTGSIGLSQALIRLLGRRKPLVIGYDQKLEENQQKFYVEKLSKIKAFEEDLRCKVIKVFPKGHVPDFMREWAYAAHPKRALRVRAHQDWVNDGCPITHGVRKNVVTVKVKTCEFLASHKPRLIGDLGVTASMMGGWMMDYFKLSMAAGYKTARVESYFLPSPDIEALRHCFSRLIFDSSYMCCIYYFSDDVVCRIICSDGVHMCNADISACDGSHRAPTMKSAESFMLSCVPNNARPYVRLLFEQLELDFQCSPPYAAGEKVRCSTKGQARLYSGSVLTTFLNNYAVSMACVSLDHSLERLGRLPTMGEAACLLASAFEDVGYILEVDDSPTREVSKFQFLKHSPALIDGFVQPYLNLGVLFRSFGTFNGDYPGKKKSGMRERVRVQNAGVVLSRVHAGDHVLADAFKHAFPSMPGDNAVYALPEHQTSSNSSKSCRRIPSEVLARRYDLSSAEIDYVAAVVANSSQGEIHHSGIVDRFLMVDYGISYPSEVEPKPVPSY